MSYGANDPNGLPLGLPSILSLGLPPLVNPYPALNLDFINNQTLDSRVTFSRGSQATLFDSTGTLVYAKHNLLLQSNSFDTSWTNTSSAEAAAQGISPDGTNTAWSLTDDAVNSNHNIFQSVSWGVGSTTFSIYAKFFTHRWIGARIGVGGNQFFGSWDLQNGVVGSVTAGATIGMQAVGNGWYRLTLTASLTSAGTANLIIAMNNADAVALTAYSGTGTTFLIYGAQLNLANMEGGVTSSLTTYYPTTTAAYYAPRFDYNPSTLQPLGLLIEEARTNGIRNNTMQGAVAGTPGTLPTNWSIFTSLTGLTREVVGTGTENGIDYIDFRLSGTPSAAGSYNFHFETITAVAASVGQAWTLSTYAKLQAGSFTGISSFQLIQVEYNSASGFLTQGTSTISPTSAALNTQRFSYTRTTSNASVAYLRPSSIFNLTGAAIDITLRIGLPQLELGAFATSVIPTTTTALTRNADVASMTGTNFSSWYNQTQGTFFADATSNATSGARPILTAQIAGGNDRHQVAVYSTVAATVNAGVVQATIGTNLTSPMKAAYAYATNDFAVSVSGAAVVTDTSGTVPTTLTYATFGKFDFGGGESINGYIRRIAYYPTRLPNSTLQALTA
jgi:hypothetical protein